MKIHISTKQYSLFDLIDSHNLKIMLKKLTNKLLNTLGYRISKIAKNSYESEADYATYKKIADIRGFFTYPAFKLFSLIQKASSKNSENRNLPVLEIGVYCGMSLLSLALMYKDSKVVGVDPFSDFFEGSAFDGEADFLRRKSNYLDGKSRLSNLRSKAASLGVASRVDIKNVTQEEFLEKGTSQKYQFIYVDGEHTHESVFSFLNKTDILLPANGLLVLDDFLSPGFPGVTEAVYTHPVFKKTLFPVCYAYNKAVFIYKPSQDYFQTLIAEIKQLAEASDLESHESDNDNSLIVQE